jgi:predicted Zn-dependent protease
VILLLLAALASAAPEDALDPAARPFYLRAVEEEDAGHPRPASKLYELVLSKDPGFVPASLGLGRCREAAGDISGAEAVYRGLGAEGDAVEALARLVAPAEALTLWKRLETLRIGDPTPYREEALLLARTDASAALEVYTRYRELLLGGEPDATALLAVGAALVDGGRPVDGEALWRAYLTEWPQGAAVAEIRARLDRMEVERAAEALALGGSEPIPPGLAPRYAAAKAAMAAGRLDDAAIEAGALVAAAPRSADAHGMLADVLVAQRIWGEAEIQAIFARALAPDDAPNRVRLGMLLVEAYGGRRDREAVEELREAAELRPADTELQYALGRAEQRLGNFEGALVAYDHILASGESGATADDVRARVEALRREPPEPPDLPPATAPQLPPDADRHLRRALVFAKRGRTDEATAEFDLAVQAAPTSPFLLNKRATFARQVGDAVDAEPWLERSLEADPAQPAVLLELGDVAKKRGDRARAEDWYATAARLGSADAHFQLARLAEERDDWGEVGVELAAYEAGAPGEASLNAAGARELRARVDRRAWGIRLGVVGALSVVIGVPFVGWARYRTARTLRDLLDGAPECWHEAARLLAGLRHEVLKHNTTVLPDVADALARGDTGPWLAFSARVPTLLQHFQAYVGQLEALGLRHGYRLGLRRRDPILGPMHRALARLARMRRPGKPEELRALSEVINGAGYAAIGQIVREICVLPVTSARVHEVYDRIGKEPGFAGAPVPALQVHQREQGLAVRMFRADLDDILANLLRNALAAGAARLDVELGQYDDPVTGHGWVEVGVVDDAPGALTNAMIRGRYIGRGLGLAVDLINRHGGSIRVDPRPDGRKVVIVQLPSVEAAPVEAEWTA